MGYRDDFYIADNIIGYTGELAANPTVYFETIAGTKTTIGRITQAWKAKENVGRNEVRVLEGYTRANENGRLVERIDGDIVHRSRNELKTMTLAVEKALLAQAIIRFPDKKEWGDLEWWEQFEAGNPLAFDALVSIEEDIISKKKEALLRKQ